LQVQQPGTMPGVGGGRRIPATNGFNGHSQMQQQQPAESDYEEIGTPGPPPPVPPPPAVRPKTAASGRPAGQPPTASFVCDLCGTAMAMVRCQLCSNQTFCLACDDMYHRHPKRCKHARKVRLLLPLTLMVKKLRLAACRWRY
jgi:hypothetical protein